MVFRKPPSSRSTHNGAKRLQSVFKRDKFPSRCEVDRKSGHGFKSRDYLKWSCWWSLIIQSLQDFTARISSLSWSLWLVEFVLEILLIKLLPVKTQAMSHLPSNNKTHDAVTLNTNGTFPQCLISVSSYPAVCPAGWKPGSDTIVPDVQKSKEFFSKQWDSPPVCPGDSDPAGYTEALNAELWFLFLFLFFSSFCCLSLREWFPSFNTTPISICCYLTWIQVCFYFRSWIKQHAVFCTG